LGSICPFSEAYLGLTYRKMHYVKLVSEEYDILIVGAGLVGLAMALCAANVGLYVGLVDKYDVKTSGDGRASALSADALCLMENLSVDISEHLEPIRDMLVTEGPPNSPWRLHFEGTTAATPNLGAMIENQHLKGALIKTVKANRSINILAPVAIEHAIHNQSGAKLATDQGALSAKLLIAADGYNSILRRKSGITVQKFEYDSVALVTVISHENQHDGLAWQRFFQTGPLAVLPLTNQRSQIVWSGPTKSLEAAKSMDQSDFLALLSEKMDDYLGKLALEAPRMTWPLRLQIADQFTSERLALIGDAAHIIHPLAGQGLNLGLRDSAALADGLKLAKKTGQDIGVAGLINYQSDRNLDTRLMGATTHSLSQLYALKNPLIGHMRRAGLALTGGSKHITQLLQAQASGQSDNTPSLMVSQK